MRTRQLVVTALTVPIIVTPLALATASTATAASASASAPVFGATWTVDTARNLLTEYAPGASAAATPLASIHGAATGLVQPTGIAISPAGALFVTEAGDNAITEYAPGATGDVAPATTIKGSATGLAAPSSIVLSGRDLWVTDPSTNVVEAFTAGSNGNELPAKSIAGRKTQLEHPVGLSLDPEADAIAAIGGAVSGGDDPFDSIPAISVINAPTTGKGYVTGYGSASLGNATPLVRVDSTAKHPMVSPSAILADGLGSVLVADKASNTVSQLHLSRVLARLFRLTGVTDIAGAKTGLDAPSGLTRNAFNQLVVTNSGDDTVGVFGQGATGNVAPRHTISGTPVPATSAVAGTQPGPPTGLTARLHRSKSATRNKVTLAWRAPTATGGGIIGYDVETTQLCVCGFDEGNEIISDDDPLGELVDRIRTTTTGTSYVRLHIRAGRKYAFRIVAVNAFGTSHPSGAATVTLPARSGPPEPPQTHVLGRAIQVFWGMPSHDGAERVTSYRLEYATCIPGAKGCAFHTRVVRPQIFGGTETLRHLAPKTTYHIRVIAKTKLGLGKPSKAVTATTKS